MDVVVPVSPSFAPRPPAAPCTQPVCGFLPPPPISASPVCTPSTSCGALSLRPANEHDPGGLARTSQLPLAAPDRQPDTMLLAPPTWIATPPTPPHKPLRRALTCVTQRPSAHRVSPSTSFPPSMFPPPLAPQAAPKRRATIPAMSSRSAAAPTFAPESSEGDRLPMRASGTTSLASSSAEKGPTPPPGLARHRPLFHIPPESDSEEGAPMLVESPTQEEELVFSAGPDGVPDESRKRDDTRRYHALMELLTTEVGYLMDLRALVTIYLRNLSPLTCRSPSSGPSAFGRSSSFASASRLNLSAHPFPASSSLAADGHAVHMFASSSKDKDKPLRFLFTKVQVELLTRNAEEILQLHEHFVEELRDVVTPLGFPMILEQSAEVEGEKMESLVDQIDVAIGAVSTKFATEASRFNSYQLFCTGHPEALDLVRKIQQQHAVEWDAFEQRCSSLIADMMQAERLRNEQASAEPPLPIKVEEDSNPLDDRKRTQSLSSIDRTARPRRSRTSTGPAALVPVELVTKARERSRRLVFMDYMIKPVQRICKYPLLLDQLKTAKSLKRGPGLAGSTTPVIRADVNVVVESASQAMRHVAASVDEARRRQDVAIQSSLIASRIVMATSTSGTSGASDVLTSVFLTSLGTCLLAGSLDVMHYQSYDTAANFKAKYLGAFLYLGGYFVLVKVCKGKVYEPKHWFSLSGFDITDVEEEDAMLPCSFRLTSQGHQFELAAACQREKEAWVSSIQESLVHEPTWINEPASSLLLDGKGDPIAPAAADGQPETTTPLPTIQSIPEFGPDEEQLTEQSLLAAFRAETKQNKPPMRAETIFKADVQPPPSRRSSSASVKAIFSPLTSDTDTIVIRRSSPAARSQVDQGLQDVISEPCLTARSYASNREEELFSAPKITRSGFARSNSGLSMAGAMGAAAKSRLTKHESVRVRRRRSVVDGPDLFSPPAKITVSRAKSLAQRRHTKKLSISAPGENEAVPVRPASELSSDSPNPFTPSSVTASNPGSASGSPVLDTLHLPPTNMGGPSAAVPRPDLLFAPGPDDLGKRRWSMADNVKTLFARPVSPNTPAGRSGDSSSTDGDSQSSSIMAAGLLRWLKMPPHRRVRSAPEPPRKPLRTHSSSPPSSYTDVGVAAGAVPSTSGHEPPPRRFIDIGSVRRQSLLSPAAPHSGSYAAPRIIHKASSLLQRFKAMDDAA